MSDKIEKAIAQIEELKDYFAQSENTFGVGKCIDIITTLKSDGEDFVSEKFSEIRNSILQRSFEEAPIPSEPILVENQTETQSNYHEEDVHEVATSKPIQEKVTWESIRQDFYFNVTLQLEIDEQLWQYLEENYNVPTRKQKQ